MLPKNLALFPSEQSKYAHWIYLLYWNHLKFAEQ